MDQSGPREAEMVGHLLRLRDSLNAHESRQERSGSMSGVKTSALAPVNEYFERMLRAVPSIQAYHEDVARRTP